MSARAEVNEALRGKPARAVAVLLALCAVPYVLPGAAHLRVLQPPWESVAEPSVERFDEPGAPPEPVAPAEGELEVKASENQSQSALPTQARTQESAPSLATAEFLERPAQLTSFFESLRALESGAERVVRVAFYGDSIVTSDYVTGTARRVLQARYGDGGHGYIAIANPWEWYFHNDVAHWASSGWRTSRITGPLAADADYGPGGVVFRGSPGASAGFGAAKEGDFGRSVSRFQLLYGAAPEGGVVELRPSSGPSSELSTVGEPAAKLHELRLPEGEHSLRLRVSQGQVKLYGVALERERGVVLDALGALGAKARTWNHLDQAALTGVFEVRPPDLIAVMLGTNESEDGGVNVARYTQVLGELLDKLSAAAPNAALLLVAPPDRAERAQGKLRSNRVLVKIIELQRKVARERNLAFFDTFAAMGGEGAMGRWLQSRPQLASADLTHPTPAGAEVLGRNFAEALIGAAEQAKRAP